MVTEWLVSTGLSVIAWFVSIVPAFDVPSWFANVGTSINSFFTSAAGLNPFVDWAFLGTISAVPIGLWSLGLLFRLGRMLLSHVPFFGGR